ncbi:Sugar phosphate isomerase/epimerase [Halapricum desulfuricans]|uniref:Sugar phosphate isomerase/epimerase n=1 Tax=Halapricum desulfuricans TaxID=2841257 RepID=A0A897NFZ4_9EURY|nr:sugar phosphate isomerase/epimerase [Halapricum desulfuricans]QSG11261.1 Sugar phosphate isomerase/epimerase [Halapricum desulfuricans]
MGLELGFVTQTTMHYTDALPAATAMNADYVELLLDGHHERSTLDADAVAETATEHELDLLVHLPFGFDVGSPYEHVREGAIRELSAALETAAAFDARKAVVHASSDAWSPAWEAESVQGTIVDALAELEVVAGESGIELCVENVPGEWFGLAEFPRLFEATDVSMTFDTGHAYVEGYDAAEQAAFVAEHADRISHVHVNDVRTRTDDHVPIGSGVLDFGRIVRPLATATLSAEVFTPSYEYVATSLNNLRRQVEALDSP